ncbi:MAG: C-GCAxxG-C-C family protein [Anaerolineae bacterium]|nr:C-GCAxxG-C-C family protein [Anaerolineae bacterium]
MNKTIVICGAGRIGRGFVADLFATAGYHIVFVDEAEPLVCSLREHGQFTVVHTNGHERTDRIISDYEVLSTQECAAVASAVSTADLVAVAVFPKDYATVATQLAAGVLIRHAVRPEVPLDVILCSNLAHAGPAFRKPLWDALPEHVRPWADEYIGTIESLVIRMVADPPAEELERSPLLVWTNGYAEFPVECRAFKGAIPSVPGLRPVNNMRAEETRKLYTYNTFHAALAYLGALRGYEQISDCFADPVVLADAEGALDESRQALQAEGGWRDDEMSAWVAGVVAQTNNAALRDTVQRYGAGPRRKLRRSDRIAGPLLMARRHGIIVPHLTRVLAAALLFRQPGDGEAVAMHEQVANLGVPGAVRALCELTEDETDIADAVEQAYVRLELEAAWAQRGRLAAKLAYAYEQRYHGCGQCTLAAILETLEEFDAGAADAVFEAATGLAGGLGLAGDGPCGAFAGAALAFGMLYPRHRWAFDGDRENKYRTYAMIQRLREHYMSAYGGITCHDVHRAVLGRSYDLRDPADREGFEAAGAHEDKCTGVVRRAAEWAIAIIGEQRLPPGG